MKAARLLATLCLLFTPLSFAHAAEQKPDPTSKAEVEYPLPQKDEDITAYRKRLQAAGFRVGGKSDDSGSTDSYSEWTNTIIFPDGDMDVLVPISARLLVNDWADLFLTEYEKNGLPGTTKKTVVGGPPDISLERSGKVKETPHNATAIITRDKSGRLVKMDIDNERVKIAVIRSGEGKVIKITYAEQNEASSTGFMKRNKKMQIVISESGGVCTAMLDNLIIRLYD